MQKGLPALIAAAAVVVLLLAAGCTATEYTPPDGNNNPPPTNASATGIWGGTDSMTGLSVVGYINPSGQAVFMRADGAQFVGPTQVSGNTLVAAIIGYEDFGNTFSDGSTYGIGTLNGTVAGGSTLTLTLTFTTNNGTTQNGSWSLSFNTLTDSGSSLGNVSANYADTAAGSVISINGNGVMTGQDPNNSCVLNGSITVINGNYDIYQVALTYQDCTGSYAPLNGVQFTGLAALDTSTSPAQLTIAVAGANASGKFALQLNLQVS